MAEDDATDHDDSGLVANHSVQSTAGLERMKDNPALKVPLHRRMNQTRMKRMRRLEKSLARMAIVTDCCCMLMVVAQPFANSPKQRRYSAARRTSVAMASARTLALPT